MMTQVLRKTEQRGRGRPRDPAKDAAIREAAWDLLAEKGYEGLTFEAVAEKAGCSRATLYRRFASKLELIEAVLHETSRAIEAQHQIVGDPRTVLIAHASGCAEYMSGDRGRANFALGECAARLPDLDRIMQRHIAAERSLYYNEFARITDSAAPDDMAFVFDTLVGAIVHHVVARQRTLQARDIEDLVDQAIAMLRKRA